MLDSTPARRRPTAAAEGTADRARRTLGWEQRTQENCLTRLSPPPVQSGRIAMGETGFRGMRSGSRPSEARPHWQSSTHLRGYRTLSASIRIQGRGLGSTSAPIVTRLRMHRRGRATAPSSSVIPYVSKSLTPLPAFSQITGRAVVRSFYTAYTDPWAWQSIGYQCSPRSRTGRSSLRGRRHASCSSCGPQGPFSRKRRALLTGRPAQFASRRQSASFSARCCGTRESALGLSGRHAMRKSVPPKPK